MSRPLTQPSTPQRGAMKRDVTYSAPGRTKITVVQLPPHELPGVLSEMRSRRASMVRTPITGSHALSSPARLRDPIYGIRQTPPSKSNRPSRRQTPNRRLSDHLTVRRRRRSSTGVVYDSAFAGSVDKDFLRLFSRTLLKEKKKADELDDQVSKALDIQHRKSFTSPQGRMRDFDLSLPLPSFDEMASPDAEVQSVKTPEQIPATSISPKPVLKSYFERILESRNRKSSRALELAFDKESSEDAGRPEAMNDIIGTSKFSIENTIVGLPDSNKGEDLSEADLRLAEPVAFDVLQDDDSSTESSRKDPAVSLNETSFRSTRSSQIGLGNITPDNYHAVHFDDVDEPDVPSWEPVSIFSDPQTHQSHLSDTDIEGQALNDQYVSESLQEDEVASADLDSDLSQSGIISGHFTVDNDDIVNEDDLSVEVTNTDKEPRSVSPSLRQVKESRSTVSTGSRILSQDSFPKTILKRFLAGAQQLPAVDNSGSPPRKRQKMSRLDANTVDLISRKSNEFLSQVMQDLSAYADHRNSDDIGLPDAVLLMNRVKVRHKFLGEDTNFSSFAQSVLPLEHLMAMENSLHDYMKYKGELNSNEPEPGEESYVDE